MSVMVLTSQTYYTYIIANVEGPYCEKTDQFSVKLVPLHTYSGKVFAHVLRVNSNGTLTPILEKEIFASHSPLMMEKTAISLVENYLKGKNNG